MTPEELEDYRQAEEAYVSEGNPNCQELPWETTSDRPAPVAQDGKQDGKKREEPPRYRMIRRTMRWLQVSANLAQIAAAAAALFGLYLALTK